MIMMSGPKVGTVIRWLSAMRIPKPRPTPTRAVRIGRPMATTDPNARSMTTTAARIPIISLDPGAAETTCSTGAPPTATCRPGRAKRSAVSITRWTALAGRPAAAASNWTTTKPVRWSRDSCRPAPGASGLCTLETCASGRRDRTSRPMAAALAGLSSGLGERSTTSALSPCCAGNRLARRSCACCEGELAREKLLSSRLPAHCASAAMATTARIQPTSTRRRWS